MDRMWVVAVAAAVLVFALWSFLRQYRNSNAQHGCPDGECAKAAPAAPRAPVVGTVPWPEAPETLDPMAGVMPANAEKAGKLSRGFQFQAGPASVLRSVQPDGARECRSLADVESAAASNSVVLMYMTGCPPCEALKPVYHAAAARAQIPFFAVDAAAVPAVIERYHLAGFPTVFRFGGGKIVGQYAGNRTLDDILLWAQSF